MAYEDVQNDIISALTLATVLQGVAVATQAPDICRNLLRNWIWRLELAQCLSLQAWQARYISDPPTASEDVKYLFHISIAVSFLRAKSRSNAEVSTADLDLAWELLHGALTGPSSSSVLKFKVSRSAQGFLAIPLCSLLTDGRIDELFRLHVWLPDNQRGDPDVAIHSHQPYAQSWILAGTGTNISYSVEDTSDRSLATHADFLPRWDDGKGKGPSPIYTPFQVKSLLVPTGQLRVVKEQDTAVHSRDMSYSIPGAAYHKSVIPGELLHATLFYFDSSRGFFKDAGILGPLEARPFGQVRDAGIVTASCLAELAGAVRSSEQSLAAGEDRGRESIISNTCYKFFLGRALLAAGRQKEALDLLRCLDPDSSLEKLSLSSPERQRKYIAGLMERGVEQAGTPAWSSWMTAA